MISFMKANTSYSLKDMIKDCSAGIHIYIGEKETGEIRRSAEKIAERTGSEVHILPGLYHGEFSISHADKYADTVRKLLKKN